MVLRLVTLLILCVTPLRGTSAQGDPFSLPVPGYKWSFPRDHGEHHGYQTEWWYYTGHLYDDAGAPYSTPPRYGFQLTFFKRVVGADLSTAKVYLAHATLTEIATKRVFFSSRVADGIIGAGRVSHDRLNVGLGDWSTEMIGNSHVLKFSIPADTEQDSRTVRLLLDAPDSSILLQGEGGHSKKGKCETCASLYYSIPHIPVKGDVYLGYDNPQGKTSVHGIAWMDHEVMSNALEANQVGWDWMALTFKSGKAITVFQLRDKGGEHFQSLRYCEGKRCQNIPKGDFTFAPSEGVAQEGALWTSPTTGATYPIRWQLTIPSQGIKIELQARVEASELAQHEPHTSPERAKTREKKASSGSGSPIYWEGPVASPGEEVIGYLEMTGYAGGVDI